jgi:perosamine synthetase
MNRFKSLASELIRGGLRRLRSAPIPALLLGATLDRDDVEIAEHWLHERDRWHDTSVVTAFEKSFASWNGSRHAFAFSAGRKALSACIYALGLRDGDEVIVPGYTCIVVQNAFDFAGVKTVHCDIELDTYGPDIASLSTCISSRTRAILLQHLYGLVCRDYEEIVKFAAQHGLKVIEDCAHITGGMFRGRRVGTGSDVAFYSSDLGKVFSTMAGGIAVTNDPKIADKLATFIARCSWPTTPVIERQLRTTIFAFLRAKESAKWWSVPYARFKYGRDETVSMSDAEIAGEKPADYFTRMPAPAANLGLNQLRKIDAYNELRRKTAKIWDSWCDENGYRKPMIIAASQPVFLRYPVLVEPARKVDLRWGRSELGVEIGVWFRSHLHPSPKIVTSCPNADRAVAKCINLPCLLGSPESILKNN